MKKLQHQLQFLKYSALILAAIPIFIVVVILDYVLINLLDKLCTLLQLLSDWLTAGFLEKFFELISSSDDDDNDLRFQ